jgi:hypothetical protein
MAELIRMDRTSRGTIVIGVVVALLATGCQSASSRTAGTGLLATLPPPTFDGPRIVQASPPAKSVAAPAVTGPAAWAPRATPRNWKWIVIHHSASPAGNMAMFDKEHKSKGWDGIGYHFVIGNGTNSGDGQVEVTPRWPAQKWGAHAKTLDNRYNEQGIGICLVGNFDLDRPTAAQMRSLTKLTAHLMQTYRVPASNVIGHRDTKATECPGRHINIASIRQAASQTLAGANASGEAQAASSELLGEIGR